MCAVELARSYVLRVMHNVPKSHAHGRLLNSVKKPFAALTVWSAE